MSFIIVATGENDADVLTEFVDTDDLEILQWKFQEFGEEISKDKQYNLVVFRFSQAAFVAEAIKNQLQYIEKGLNDNNN